MGYAVEIGSGVRSSTGKCRTSAKESQRSTVKIFVPNELKGKQNFKLLSTPSVSSIGKLRTRRVNYALLPLTNLPF